VHLTGTKIASIAKNNSNPVETIFQFISYLELDYDSCRIII